MSRPPTSGRGSEPPSAPDLGIAATTGQQGPDSRQLSAWAAHRWELQSALKAQKRAAHEARHLALLDLFRRWKARLAFRQRR